MDKGKRGQGVSGDASKGVPLRNLPIIRVFNCAGKEWANPATEREPGFVGEKKGWVAGRGQKLRKSKNQPASRRNQMRDEASQERNVKAKRKLEATYESSAGKEQMA